MLIVFIHSLLSDFPRVEICDFGCCLAEEDKSMKVSYPTRDMYLGGNSWLMAPEVCNNLYT